MARNRCTVVWNKQESRRKHWATRSSIPLLANTAHSFACSALLPLLARSAVLIRLFTCSLSPELLGKWIAGCLKFRVF